MYFSLNMTFAHPELMNCYVSPSGALGILPSSYTLLWARQEMTRICMTAISLYCTCFFLLATPSVSVFCLRHSFSKSTRLDKCHHVYYLKPWTVCSGLEAVNDHRASLWTICRLAQQTGGHLTLHPECTEMPFSTL